ncbi:MAG: diguanylate cyclase domain-containing protein, partial [Marinicella sp.]
PMISVLLALFYNARVVVTFTAIMLLLVALIGYGFISDYLKLVIDANQMMLNSNHWQLYLLGLTFFVLFVSAAILKYKKTMLHLIEQITANKLAMEKLANHDQLTGLPISQLAQVHFEKAVLNMPKDKNIALMFLDLDKFKLINDTYGHDAGDLCLQHVAVQSKAVLKSGQIYRLGGDEFLIVVENFIDNEEVMSVAYDVVKSIAEPLIYQGHVITVETSIGVAIYKQQGEKFNDLRRAADMAMYKAKQSHDANICLVSNHSQ